MDISMLTRMLSEEPLHEDLQQHVVDSKAFSKLLHHPLLISPCIPGMYHVLNAGYAQKKAQTEAALDEQNWTHYLALHERPYRLEALLRCIDEGMDTDVPAYGSALRWVWTDSENIHQSFDDWVYLWEQSDISCVMSSSEQHALAAMPEQMPIYRGVCYVEAARGMSWSVDRDLAVWFARRFADDCDRKPLLYQGEVKRSDVWSYLTSRGESEIVVDPSKVVKLEKHSIRS